MTVVESLHGATTHTSPPVADDDPGVAVSGQLHRLFRMGARMKGELAASRPGGLEMPTLVCLHRLAEDGPLRGTDLAERMHMDPSQVSRSVAALVRDHAVVRRADPADGRATLLVVTEAGHAVADRFARASAEFVRSALADWDPEESRALLSGLTRLIDGLDRILPARDGRLRDSPQASSTPGGDDAAQLPVPPPPPGAKP